MQGYPKVTEMARQGFFLGRQNPGNPEHSPKRWLHRDAYNAIVMDADMVTAASTQLPGIFTTYIDPAVIEVLTAPKNARNIFNERQIGDWTTSTAMFRIAEFLGATEAYSDFAHNRTSGVNYAFTNRQNYMFQTYIEVGDLEAAVSGEARLDLVADKQRAAAEVIDYDANRFALFGVAGMNIYGILNDPGLGAVLSPLPNGARNGQTNSPLWVNKTATQIYNDIVNVLFYQLVEQNKGYINNQAPLTLVMSPQLDVRLGSVTEFGVTVMSMLRQYFPNLTIETVPQMSSEDTGETMLMKVDAVRGQRTGELAFNVKLQTGRQILDHTSFSQKYFAGTYGAIYYYPLGVAQMRGM